MKIDKSPTRSHKNCFLLGLGTCYFLSALSCTGSPKTFVSKSRPKSQISLVLSQGSGDLTACGKAIKLRREQVIPKIKEILQAPVGIDHAELKKIAQGEAESRWEIYTGAIEQLRQSQTKQTPVDLDQQFFALQDDATKQELLKNHPVELFDLWKKSNSDDQKRKLFSFLPKLFQIAVCGQIFLENQALGDSLWEQFPMDERVLYYVLLSPAAQKTCHSLLPEAVQKRLSPEPEQTNP